MPDYNSDKEGFVPHKFVVLNADIQPRQGVNTSKGFLKFNDQERMMVKDESLAREIQSQYGRNVTVTRVRTPDRIEKGHTYHFGELPAMPWHRYDENGFRIKEEEQDDEPEEPEFHGEGTA